VVPIEATSQLGHIDNVGLVVLASRVDHVEPTSPNQPYRLAEQPRHRLIDLTVIFMLMKHHLRTLPRKTGNKGKVADENRR
jgi:hypothetical protein